MKRTGIPLPLSWRLWRALNHPDSAHPLFRRSARPQPRDRLGLAGCLREVITVVALFSWPLGVLFFATPLGATWYSMLLAYHTVSYLVRERDVLALAALSPAGGLNAAWLVCAACHRHRQEMYQFYTMMYWFILILLGSLCVSVYAATMVAMTISSNDEVLPALLTAGMLVLLPALLLFDRVQSMALGALVGMLAPLAERSQGGGQVWAAGMVLAAQGVLYAAFALLVLFTRVNPAVTASAATALFAAREVLLHVLWRRLLDATNADAREARLLLHAKPGAAKA